MSLCQSLYSIVLFLQVSVFSIISGLHLLGNGYIVDSIDRITFLPPPTCMQLKKEDGGLEKRMWYCYRFLSALLRIASWCLATLMVLMCPHSVAADLILSFNSQSWLRGSRQVTYSLLLLPVMGWTIFSTFLLRSSTTFSKVSL